MGVVSAFKSVLQFWRTLISSIQACYRWICNNFIILVAICILLIVCRFFPSVLSFLISCAPILICTAVLLSTLLSSGYSNEAQDEEKRVYETSTNARRIEKQRERDFSSAEARLRKRNDFRARALERSGLAYGSRASSSREKKVAFLTTQHDDLFGRKYKIEELPRGIPRVPSSNVDDAKEELRKKESDDDSDEVETSNFDSDQAECSSPDTPPMNVLPVIDEIDPLLDTKLPQVPLTSTDELDAAVESSDRSIDESGDSEAENQEERQRNEEDGAALVTWTEDDEKNLMDLGTSELERNQRLENLMAKRRARKVAEKNLIDFDTNDPPVQIPSITTVKTNPFDIPYNSSEINGLPPVPGSAPSVLVPRGNPFDIPYDPQEEKPNLTGDSFQQEFMSVFCRHESFSLGPSYMGGTKLDRYNTKFTPYFGAGSMTASEGNQYSSLPGQQSERRNPASWSLHDSESLPPIDRKNRKKQMDRVLSLGVYPQSHYAAQEKTVPEVNFMRTVQEVKRDTGVNKVETKEVEKDLRMHDKSEAFTEPEVVKESSLPSSSEIKEEVYDVKIEKSQSKEPPLSFEESEGVDDDAHTKEPVYDSSPSAVEKRTIDEYLVYSDKGPALTSASSIASDMMQFEVSGLTATSSIASDMQVEVSEAGSPRESLDRYPYADGELSSFHDGIDKNAMDSRDNAVEEKEVRPVEETENNEYDSVKAGVPLHDSVSESSNETPMEPELKVEQPVNNSSSVLPQVDESVEKDQTNDAPPSSTGSERPVDEIQQPDLVLVDSRAPSPSSDLDKGEPLPEERTVRPSFDNDHYEESQERSLLKSTEVANNNDSKDNDNPISKEENTERDDDNTSINQKVVDNAPEAPMEATTTKDVEESSDVHNDTTSKPIETTTTTTEVVINPSKPMEATMVDVEESSGVLDVLPNPLKPMETTTTEVPSKPMEATPVDVEESKGVPETTQVLINHPSKSMEATMVDVEESRVGETSDVEDKQHHEEKEEVEHKEDEKENKSESDKIEVPSQDQNSTS